MLSVDIQHQFEQFQLDVSFQAPTGITVLFGASGCGKSSVVNAISGLMQPNYAQISLDGHTLTNTDVNEFVATHRRNVGHIFQDARLFPHMNVARNLRYGRYFSRGKPSQLSFDEVVNLLGLSQLLDNRPTDLSGGETQRVAIGRALLSNPKLLLADEPLASLDQARKAEIIPYFERLRDELRIPIVYVTHSPSEMARLATTIVLLDKGRVTRFGPARQVLSDPAATPNGPRAVGAVIDAVVTRHHEDGLTELSAGETTLFVPAVSFSIGRALRVRVAAQDVILSRTPPEGLSALNVIGGTITNIHIGDGPAAMISLDTHAGTVLARITQRSRAAMALKVGQNCFAILKTVSVANEDVG